MMHVLSLAAWQKPVLLLPLPLLLQALGACHTGCADDLRDV